jgi:Predicted divalent heavy-metal cations transporter
MNPLLLTLLAGLFILGGTFLGFFIKNNKKFINFSIGVALGVIGSLIIFELIPEAYEHLELSSEVRTILMLVIIAAIGFLVMNIMDKFIPHHHHESKHNHKHKDDECHNSHLGHVGILTTVALLLHNIIEGMTLYVTATTSLTTGYLLCVGIGLHNIPLGIIIASTLNSKKQIFISSIFLVLSTFFGGLIMNLLNPIDDFLVGILISLTLGMLIYIAVMELLNQIIHSKEKKISIVGILVGIVILIISVFVI